MSVAARLNRELKSAACIARGDRGLDSPIAYLRAASGREVAVWLVGPSPELNTESVIEISYRTLKCLGVPAEDRANWSGELVVVVPERTSLRAVPAIAESIGDRLEVETHQWDNGDWALLSFVGRDDRWITAPVRMRSNPHLAAGEVRMPHMLRHLLGVNDHSQGLFAMPLDWKSFEAEQPDEVFRRLGKYLASLVRKSRRIFERELGRLLGAPGVLMRVAGAPPGENGNRIASIPARTMDVTGVEVGQQIVVSWGERWAAAIALPKPPRPSDREADGASQVQISDTFGSRPANRPSERVVLLPAEIRAELGIHGETVVRVRRRLVPVLMRHIGTLSLPLAAIVFAALAVPQIVGPGALIGSMAVLLVVGVLVAARHTRPPGGRF